MIMRNVWDKTFAFLKEDLGPKVIESWFSKLEFINDAQTPENVLILRFPSFPYLKYVKGQYGSLIQKRLMNLQGAL